MFSVRVTTVWHGNTNVHILLLNLSVTALLAWACGPDYITIFCASALLHLILELGLAATGVRKGEVFVYGRKLSRFPDALLGDRNFKRPRRSICRAYIIRLGRRCRHEDDDPAIGIVDLLPLGECLVDRDWSGVLYFDWMRDDTVSMGGRTWTAWDLGRAMRPVDRFSVYRSVAFFMNGGETPRLFMGDDHDATWSYSRPVDFESYLELVVKNRGSIAARPRALQVSRRSSGPLRVEPGDPVAIDALLPERHAFSPGDRVVFHDPYLSGRHRATVLGNDVGSTHPEGWDRSTRFVRIRADRGDVLLLSDPPRPLDAHDAYEDAMADVPAFFAGLLAEPARSRFEALAAIVPDLGSSTGYRLSAFDPDGPSTTVSLSKLSVRFNALSARLDAAVAVDAWSTLIEGFLDDNVHFDVDLPMPPPIFTGDRAVSTGRYSTVVQHLVCALTAEVFRAHRETPFASLREGFGDELAERVGAVAERLQGLRHNRGASRFSNTELLRTAVDRLPGVLPEPDHGRAYRGSQFGLEAHRIL